MNTKSTNDIIKKIHEEKGLSESFLDDVVEFFYKELRTEINSLDHSEIEVPGLGHYFIRRNTLRSLLKKIKTTKEKNFTDPILQKHFRKKELDLDKLQALYDKVISRTEERIKFYENKRNS